MDIQVTYVRASQRGVQRDRQRVTGPTLRVGRGTQCQVHLPDPRVALRHADIVVSETGAAVAAEVGHVTVNGDAVAGAQIKVGDRIEVGPYLLEIEAPPEGMGFALSVTLVTPLETPGGDSDRLVLRAPRLSKRRLSYVAFWSTLLLCLLIPVSTDLVGHMGVLAGNPLSDQAAHFVQTVSARFTQGWNPGPVSRSHQIFESDCRACHQTPFVQIRDKACTACHKTVSDHVPKAMLTGERGQAFAETRCAECHRDHRGAQMAPRAQEQCGDCHRDVKQVAAKASSEGVTDFKSNHPEFRLSLLDANTPDVIKRVRQGQQASVGMQERSNLKFNHKLHLDPNGVRDPKGKYSQGSPGAKLGPTVLTCTDCHQTSEGGRLIAPISMEQHCQRCHSLTFEPKVTARQAVHGDPEKIATMLREFYALLVLGDVPPDVNPPADLQRMRPGAQLTYEERQQALQIADAKTALVMRELLETRKVCSTCHEVSRTHQLGGWRIAPVRVARVWMPQALFSHARHSTQDCVKCHNVVQSTDAKHIAMPGIAVCRECHVGAQPVAGMVTSDCAMCHKFHAGREYWHAMQKAQTQAPGNRGY